MLEGDDSAWVRFGVNSSMGKLFESANECGGEACEPFGSLRLMDGEVVYAFQKGGNGRVV